jgi:hypothetical protein
VISVISTGMARLFPFLPSLRGFHLTVRVLRQSVPPVLTRR